MQVEQEPVLVQGLRSLVAQDTGLHIQAEGLSPAQTHLRRTGKQLIDGENQLNLRLFNYLADFSPFC